MAARACIARSKRQRSTLSGVTSVRSGSDASAVTETVVCADTRHTTQLNRNRRLPPPLHLLRRLLPQPPRPPPLPPLRFLPPLSPSLFHLSPLLLSPPLCRHRKSLHRLQVASERAAIATAARALQVRRGLTRCSAARASPHGMLTRVRKAKWL